MAGSTIVEETPTRGATPLVFGSPDRALFGFYHRPEGPARGVGVVLCNPLGYEAMCSHRTYRRLADRLAARGVPALRFDYHGTGDSSGEPDEPGRVDAWLASIDAAVRELRQRAGVGSVALFGVRFGATLAVTAAANGGGIDGLILWAPTTTGREYVREVRAFRMIKRPPDGVAGAPRNGGEEAAGYHFDEDTVSSLASIDPLARTGQVAKRVLIVPRDDLPGGEMKLAKHLEKCGAEVRVVPAPGYARMMRDPQDTVVPDGTLEGMIDWLLEAAYPASRASPNEEPGPTLLTASAPSGGTSVRERYVHFGAGRRLFGIVTEPVGDAVSSDRPAIVFLNVGANHRVGPNRMYVSMARDLAAHGYYCLRFDVGGLGDSKIAPGAQENRLYSKDSVVDVKAAMTLLGETHHVRRFVLVGLCSGAYLAFHTCVEDQRVVGQVLLNPQTFEWKDGDSLELSTRSSFNSTRYYVRSLLNPVVWRRALRGEVQLGAIARVLRERFVARTVAGIQSIAARARSEPEPFTEVARAFRTMSDRGVESLLIFSFDDGGLDMIEKHLGSEARKMRGRENFRLAIVEHADHTFTPVGSQLTVRALIVRDMTVHFPRVAKSRA
jgi:pimeloyl-ACP methyl ester carboxylesterase